MTVVDDFMREEINKEIAIDDRLTSSVIGPRGARIGGVRKKTSAMVKIGDDKSVENGTRKISISGTMKEVMWAFNAVRNLILDAQEEMTRLGPLPNIARSDSPPPSKLLDLAKSILPYNPSQDRSSEKINKEINIPNKNTGMVLGRKASIINEIRNVSNCKVLVDKDSQVVSDMRRIEMIGTAKEVHLAEFLLEAVQQMPRDVPQTLGLL